MIKLTNAAMICGLVIVAAGVGISSHYREKSEVSILPAEVAENTLGRASLRQVPPMVSPRTGEYSLPKPVKRIIHSDNTCAGVVRADGSSDGECPPESANLTTIVYEEALPHEGSPPD